MNISELRETPYFENAPQRVISLIPSMTENLISLGFGDSLIGVTDYCIIPEDFLQKIIKLGGPKNPDVEKILELTPDLIIVNQEESSVEVVQKLHDAGIKIWLTFPKTVVDSMSVLYSLLGIFKNNKAAIQLKSLQAALEFVELSNNEIKKTRYFCPIWQDKFKDIEWMMTFNEDTYPNDLLRVCGGENIFSDRKRKYPIEADLDLGTAEDSADRDTRYPRVKLQEIIDKNPELIILPSEPFEYDESYLEEFRIRFADTDAVKNNRIIFVDGSLLFWPGVTMGRALQNLPRLIVLE